MSRRWWDFSSFLNALSGVLIMISIITGYLQKVERDKILIPRPYESFNEMLGCHNSATELKPHEVEYIRSKIAEYLRWPTYSSIKADGLRFCYELVENCDDFSRHRFIGNLFLVEKQNGFGAFTVWVLNLESGAMVYKYDVPDSHENHFPFIYSLSSK
jgi:hypothetical protein